MRQKRINIFCIIANVGSEQEQYLKYILDDSKFVKEANLERLVYNTTKPVRKEDAGEYKYYSVSDYNKIPKENIIDDRSYYTIIHGEVYYFTLDTDIKSSESNLICIASPYQYENYKRFVSISNIKNPGSYNLSAILIHCSTKNRIINKIMFDNDNDDDKEILELCRRMLQDNAEFEDVKQRIPEFRDTLSCNNTCFINSDDCSDYVFNANIRNIKGFILQTINNN